MAAARRGAARLPRPRRCRLITSTCSSTSRTDRLSSRCTSSEPRPHPTALLRELDRSRACDRAGRGSRSRRLRDPRARPPQGPRLRGGGARLGPARPAPKRVRDRAHVPQEILARAPRDRDPAARRKYRRAKCSTSRRTPPAATGSRSRSPQACARARRSLSVRGRLDRQRRPRPALPPAALAASSSRTRRPPSSTATSRRRAARVAWLARRPRRGPPPMTAAAIETRSRAALERVLELVLRDGEPLVSSPRRRARARRASSRPSPPRRRTTACASSSPPRAPSRPTTSSGACSPTTSRFDPGAAGVASAISPTTCKSRRRRGQRGGRRGRRGLRGSCWRPPVRRPLGGYSP